MRSVPGGVVGGGESTWEQVVGHQKRSIERNRQVSLLVKGAQA